MTIDINELRRLAQAALAGPDGTSLNWIKLLQDFQQKVSPAAVSELLDRLEEAESDALEQARLNGMGASREAALMAKLEAAEKEVEIERMRLAACGVAALGYFEGCAEEYISASLNDVLALRAKIEAIERQKPVAEWVDGAFDQRWADSGGPVEECDVPPLGWRCTRGKDHTGPCAAIESPEDVALVERGMARLREAALMAKLEAAEKDIALKEKIIDALGSALNAVANERDDVAWQLAQSEQGKRKISEECDALLASLDAAESVLKDFGTTAQEVECWLERYRRLEREAEAMRTRIEAMERQEPVAWRTFDGEGGYDYRSYEDNENYQLGWNARNPNHAGWVEPLYLAPGAQLAPSVPDVDALAQFIRKVDGAHQLGAVMLAERIADWLASAPDAKP